MTSYKVPSTWGRPRDPSILQVFSIIFYDQAPRKLI